MTTPDNTPADLIRRVARWCDHQSEDTLDRIRTVPDLVRAYLVTVQVLDVEDLDDAAEPSTLTDTLRAARVRRERSARTWTPEAIAAEEEGIREDHRWLVKLLDY